MKVFNTISKSVLAAAIFSIFTYSCDNLQSPEPFNPIDEDQTATVRGVVTIADTSGSEAPAPEGTSVRLVIDSEQYAENPNPGVTYQDIVYNAELGSEGEYSFDVPALTNRTISADLFLVDIEEDGVIYEASPNPLAFNGIIYGSIIQATDTVTYIPKY